MHYNKTAKRRKRQKIFKAAGGEEVGMDCYLGKNSSQTDRNVKS